ncbi:MAG: peptide ABC transporter substrate-binding protein [Chloroflexota bacterium]|nr:peptide ABC transporter substrate-binding protein [Chloroflexota bacterium]
MTYPLRSATTILAALTLGLSACAPGAPAAPTTAPPAAAATTAPTVAAKPTTSPAAAAASAAPSAAASPSTAPGASASPSPAGAAATSAPAPAAAAPAAPKPIPADAAPPEQQVLVFPFDNTADFTTLDFWESVYKRGNSGVGSDLMTEPLVRINKNFEIVPAAATTWAVDSTNLVWTFNLDPNLIWSDDTPVTADDFVATFRYGADPKHAWDFTWFYGGVIKNWDEAVKGTLPLDQLGVRAVDAHTLQIETVQPAPYIPAMMLYSQGMQKKALETVGGLYNSDPATSVSDGPFILKEWRKGDRLEFIANPKYKGSNKPFIQRVINIGSAKSAEFAAYQAGEFDYVPGPDLSPADNVIIGADPQLSKEVHPHYGDFRTDYLFFDNQNPPFNNLKVRQAFSHIVPRDDLVKQIITPTQGIPAYSFLMPGFPASNSQALKDIQSYDPAMAKQLLADAGFPGGAGFPKLTLWLRNEDQVRQQVAQAIAASISQNLGISVDVSNKENKTFTDAMNAKPPQIQFGMVSYGFDFLDPYNMLSVWLGDGRHNWKNADFDAQVKAASSFTGDPATRIKMFQDAEKILVSDVGGVFIDHRTVADLYKPYLKGSELEPDKNGFAAMHWPTFGNPSALVGSLYISRDVASSGRKLP